MAARKVLVRQVDKKRGVYATAVLTSPLGHRYFLFGSAERAAAMRLTERQALAVLDEWRDAERAPAGKCIIEPA